MMTGRACAAAVGVLCANAVLVGAMVLPKPPSRKADSVRATLHSATSQSASLQSAPENNIIEASPLQAASPQAASPQADSPQAASPQAASPQASLPLISVADDPGPFAEVLKEHSTGPMAIVSELKRGQFGLDSVRGWMALAPERAQMGLDAARGFDSARGWMASAPERAQMGLESVRGSMASALEERGIDSQYAVDDLHEILRLQGVVARGHARKSFLAALSNIIPATRQALEDLDLELNQGMSATTETLAAAHTAALLPAMRTASRAEKLFVDAELKDGQQGLWEGAATVDEAGSPLRRFCELRVRAATEELLQISELMETRQRDAKPSEGSQLPTEVAPSGQQPVSELSELTLSVRASCRALVAIAELRLATALLAWHAALHDGRVGLSERLSAGCTNLRRAAVRLAGVALLVAFSHFCAPFAQLHPRAFACGVRLLEIQFVW